MGGRLFYADAAVFFSLLHKAWLTSRHARFMLAFASVHIPRHLLRTLSISLRTLLRVKYALAAPPQPAHLPRAAALSLAGGRLSFQ